MMNPHSKEVAKHNRVNYIEVEVDDQKIADNYRKAIWHNEGLIYNAQGVAKYLLSQAVHREGYKVVLTGEGADEIFAGYPFFREDILQEGNAQNQDFESLKEVNKLISGAFLSSGDYESVFQDVQKSLGYVPSMWKVGAKFGERFMNLYHPEIKTSFSSRNPYNEAVARLDAYKIRRFHPLNRSLYLWSKTKLPQVILSFLGDRMEMANSVEARLPFLDHRMVEFAQLLPPHMKINNMVEKYILREAAKNLIPENIYKRQKFPFTAPPIIQDRSEGRSLLHQMTLDYLNSTNSSANPFYNPKKVEVLMEHLMDQPLHERAGADPIINRVLSSSILAEQYALIT